ncbi:MAG: hypothetical protein LBF86_04680 [Helicobacteraceae bacterium]|jgi:hypothetical protein|nr:hypothetical protein [Helicobacteraceae bacterium]
MRLRVKTRKAVVLCAPLLSISAFGAENEGVILYRSLGGSSVDLSAKVSGGGAFELGAGYRAPNFQVVGAIGSVNCDGCDINYFGVTATYIFSDLDHHISPTPK